MAAHDYVNGNCFAVPTVVGQNGPTLIPISYGPAFFDSDLSIFKNFAIKESMKLQIRAMAYNFLNHPLYSFPSGPPDPAVRAGSGLGDFQPDEQHLRRHTQKQGARVIEFGAKFYF